MVSERDYWKSIEELIVVCKRSQHKGDIIAIYLGGSVARGDFSPGRSDIDIYVVTSGKKEEIGEELKEAARKIATERLKDLLEVHREPIGISLTTVSESQAGNSFLAAGFEYENFINTGKLLYGRDIKSLIPKPTREEERALAERALKEVCAFVTERELSVDEQNRERLSYGIFSSIFRTACIALCGKGRYVSGKRKAVMAFHEVYMHESPLCQIISQTLELWEEWERRSLTEEELQRLTGFSLEFVSEVCRLWGIIGK
ncbi:nucleotidyltransferase domain-containing protein [Candidatus Acetothermia bacterium]|jgi:predicted nucleotidyltransferase|nr:nucleotidyltransferase domain-containing protein [Candidatus Acetothermia bacterium]